MLNLYFILYMYIVVNNEKNKNILRKMNKSRYLGRKVYQVEFWEVKEGHRPITLQIRKLLEPGIH